ncbi:MAG: hypothetical protein IPH76_18880 [Xanthomonadales bacterium]|nr:hypothetical protein [Xanthomonadales bacterium]
MTDRGPQLLALYVQSVDVVALYAHPLRLWLALPVLLYWLARLWTLAGRGELRADPILFALRDAARARRRWPAQRHRRRSVPAVRARAGGRHLVLPGVTTACSRSAAC